MRVFHEKLKDDDSRSICKSKRESDKQELAQKARHVMKIQWNYPVFLYQIIGQKVAAIDVAQKTHNNCSQSVEWLSDESYSATMIAIELLSEKMSLRTRDDDSAS
jgi:hypothetical protein